jgi:hypothetical protein
MVVDCDECRRLWREFARSTTAAIHIENKLKLAALQHEHEKVAILTLEAETAFAARDIARGEKSTAELAKASEAVGFHENASAAHAGGRVAGDARRNLERQLKRSVVSRSNSLENSRKKDPQKLTQPPPSRQKR